MLNRKLLTPLVSDLVGNWLKRLPKPESPWDAYEQMLRHPVITTSISTRILNIAGMLGEYYHPTPEEGKKHKPSAYQIEVRKSIENMDGSFRVIVPNLLKGLVYGWSFCEVAHKVYKKAELLGMRVADVKYSYFESRNGNIEKLVITKPYEIKVDYNAGIHFTYQDYLNTEYTPYGNSLLRRAYPYYQLFQIVMAAVTIASQRQGTPFIYGKTDTAEETYILDSSGNPMLDENGLPKSIKRGYKMQQELEKAENSSAIVIDIMDELGVIEQQTDGKFFELVLKYLEGMMLLCFEIPRTVLGTGASASGDSNLNEGHRTTLEHFDLSVAKLVDELLIEKAIKPMLQYNHGDLDDYGSFLNIL